MRKREETSDTNTNQGFIEQERTENFDSNFHTTLSVDIEDGIQPISSFDMSKIRGGMAGRHPDKFTRSCGGIMPQ